MAGLHQKKHPFFCTLFSHQKSAFALIAVFLFVVFLLAGFQQKSNSFDFSFFSAQSHSEVKSPAVLQLDSLTPKMHKRFFSVLKQRAEKHRA